MSPPRKKTPYKRKGDGVWQDGTTSLWDGELGFEAASDLRMDLQEAILQLPTMQRIAVQKWMRDESLTGSESNALYHAKRNLRKCLE